MAPVLYPAEGRTRKKYPLCTLGEIPDDVTSRHGRTGGDYGDGR